MDDNIENLVNKLIREHNLTKEEFTELLEHWEDPAIADRLSNEALRLRREIYGNDIYVRGLIEFSNICKQDCYYCGIRKSNPEPERYRLKQDEILACCEYGYELGLRTFVLQSGEDGYYTDEIMTEIVREIRTQYPDCAITLSLGERSFTAYQAFREAGADRYLLREETANEAHYRRLHPDEMSLNSRINCLYDLTSLDYQVGAGFMVGSPYQTLENIAEDLVFLHELEPEMVGIGPFIPHCDTRFAEFQAGSVGLTLFLLSVIRIMLPDVLLPATTALATLDPEGREKGMLAGANVIMPNITPKELSGQYALYNNKISAVDDVGERLREMTESMEAAGFRVVYDRGDHRMLPGQERQSEPQPEERRDTKAEREEQKLKKKKHKEKKKEKEKAKKQAKKTKKQDEKKKHLETKEKKKKENSLSEPKKEKHKKKDKKNHG